MANKESSYAEFLEIISDFFKSNNKDDLLESANKLIFLLENENDKHFEAYIWLSYIFHIFDKNKVANNCLKIAKKMEPNNNLIKKLNLVINNMKTTENKSQIEDIADETLKLYGN